MLIFVTGLVSPVVLAHSKATREQLNRLDEKKIVDTALRLMKSIQREKVMYMPDESGGDFIVRLEDLMDYLVEGTRVHQYARSYTARDAMDYMNNILKSKSDGDIEASLRFIAFTIPWASDSLVFHFDTFINNADIPLELRMRALIHVLQSSLLELSKQGNVARERRRIQLDEIQKRFMGGVEAEIFGLNLESLKTKIGEAAEALNAEFCEGVLTRQSQLNLGSTPNKKP
jgi:hypothetical protein